MIEKIMILLTLLTIPFSIVSSSEKKPSESRMVFESPRWWTPGKVYFTNEFIRASYETIPHRPFYTSIDVEINKKRTLLFKCSPFGLFGRNDETRSIQRSKEGLFEFHSVRKVPTVYKPIPPYWGIDGTITFGPGREEISLLNKVMTARISKKNPIRSFSFIFNRFDNTQLWIIKNGEREAVDLKTRRVIKTDNFIMELPENYVIEFKLDRKLSSPDITNCGIYIRPTKKTVTIELHITNPHAKLHKSVTVAGKIKIKPKNKEVPK